jgi:predicted GIY-YIG superfamily endonuclease
MKQKSYNLSIFGKKNKTWCTYRIISLTHNIVYYGATQDFRGRMIQHCNNSDSLIGHAIKKYGMINFKTEIIGKHRTRELAEAHESRCCNRFVIKYGFNALYTQKWTGKNSLLLKINHKRFQEGKPLIEL